MRKFMFVAFMAMTLISCEKIQGEGPVFDQDYNVTSTLSTINVGSAIKLELSDEYAPGEVLIETYGNIFQYINFKESGDILSIWLDNKRYKGDLNVRVYASAAQYSSVVASGAANVSLLDEIQYESYKVVLSGASRFTMSKESDIENLSINASGASNATILGSSSQCEIKASGASSISGAKFTCDDLDLYLSGSSDLKIYVNESIKGLLTGASTLRYGGDAELKVDTSGASSVKPI